MAIFGIYIRFRGCNHDRNHHQHEANSTKKQRETLANITIKVDAGGGRNVGPAGGTCGL